MSLPPLPWAALRTLIAALGLSISAGALILACLDYAGEEVEACDADAGAKSNGCADAAAPVPTGGSGSGS